ncbi:helix-turn-helix domain-containing protein [Sutcliffiella horikoshii]|uniref:helix-turn-helix domain-containing protein n=1 Tax=Sutcliffiella horikoshii TaxID=79883 RepID=UPI00384B4BD9
MNHEVIKHARQLANLTQRELALKVGVDTSYISKLENGTIPLQPAIERKILEVFDGAGIGEQEITSLKNVFVARNIKTVQKGSVTNGNRKTEPTIYKSFY